MITTDQFLADLNKTASRYYTNSLNDAPDEQIVPRFWEDSRIRVLPYDRGGMYFAVLNGKIGGRSAGKRSIDDLIQAMIDRSRANLSTRASGSTCCAKRSAMTVRRCIVRCWRGS